MAPRSAVINVMAKAADKAARALKRDFGEVSQLQVSMKGPGDFVSTADHKSERTIREELTKARPNFGLLMEESGAIPGSDPDHTWIVDPLDGTTNFLHGLPHFSISIALQAKGEIIAGLVFDPQKPSEKTQKPRRSSRTALSADVSLRRLGQNSYRVKVADLSPEGCKVDLVERPRIGEHMLLKFEGLEVLDAETCWIEGYVAGLRFEKPIHSAVFDLLLQRLK